MWPVACCTQASSSGSWVSRTGGPHPRPRQRSRARQCGDDRPGHPTGPLPGMKVLIVEDEALVALTIEDVLAEAGYDVIGIADRPSEALRLTHLHEPDLAV